MKSITGILAAHMAEETMSLSRLWKINRHHGDQTGTTTPPPIIPEGGGGSTTVGPVSASTSTVIASPGSIVDDGVATSTVTVTLKDANLHPVPSKIVTLAKSGGSSVITTVSGTTDANGHAIFTVTDTAAETTTYTATDTTDSLVITQTAAITFTAGAITESGETLYGSFNRADVDAPLVSWIGKTPAVSMFFQRMPVDGSTTPSAYAASITSNLTRIWDLGSIPMYSWAPSPQTFASTTLCSDIAAGKYDVYVNAAVTAIKDWLAADSNRRAYIRFAHEMNGSWFPWHQSPNTYIAMWRYVYGKFAGVSADSLRWHWCVNRNDSSTSFKAEQYYPGDAYVDWVGIDGYAFASNHTQSGWVWPAKAFDDMVARLQALTTKPMSAQEWGVLSGTTALDNTDKAEWLRQALDYFLAKQFRHMCYFNINPTETTGFHQWTVFGPLCSGPTNDECVPAIAGDTQVQISGVQYRGFGRYKTAVAAAAYIGADSGNPRVITNAQFQGAPRIDVSAVPMDFVSTCVIGVAAGWGIYPTVGNLYSDRLWDAGMDFFLTTSNPFLSFTAAMNKWLPSLRTNRTDLVTGATYRTKAVVTICGRNAWAANNSAGMWTSNFLNNIWTPFITQLCNYYGAGKSHDATDAIEGWEIWNESDAGGTTGTPTGNTTQCVANWIALVKIAAPLLRAAGFKVMGPASQSSAHDSSGFIYKVAQQGGAKYLDVITRHHYRDLPETVADYLQAEIQLVQSFADMAGKPWYVTEVQKNTSTPQYEDSGIAYIQRLYILSWVKCRTVGGKQILKRIYWWGYDGTGVTLDHAILTRSPVDATHYPSGLTSKGETVVAKAWGSVNGTTFSGKPWLSLQRKLVGAKLNSVSVVGTVYTVNVTYPGGGSGSVTWDGADLTNANAIPTWS